MRVTSSEVMGNLTVDDDKEKAKEKGGGGSAGVDENAAERGRKAAPEDSTNTT